MTDDGGKCLNMVDRTWFIEVLLAPNWKMNDGAAF